MVIEPAFGTFGSVGRCQVLLENEISISIKLVSRRKHGSALKFPGRWLRWLWTSENTVDQHQQMTWQPKSSLTVETSHWTSSNMDSVAPHQSMWAERSGERSVRNIVSPVPLRYRSHHESRARTNPPTIHLCLQQLTKLSAYTSVG